MKSSSDEIARSICTRFCADVAFHRVLHLILHLDALLTDFFIHPRINCSYTSYIRRKQLLQQHHPSVLE